MRHTPGRRGPARAAPGLVPAIAFLITFAPLFGPGVAAQGVRDDAPRDTVPREAIQLGQEEPWDADPAPWPEPEVIVDDEPAGAWSHALPEWLGSPWSWALPALLLLLAVLAWTRARSGGPDRRIRWVVASLVLVALALIAGGIILAQQRGGDSDGTHTRTRARRGACQVGVEFGVQIVDPQGNATRDLFMSTLQAGIGIDSNGHLRVKGTNVAVAPYSGTLTIRFYRGPSGRTPFDSPISGPIRDDQDLAALLATRDGNPVRLNAPPGIAENNTPITELLRVVATYQPDGDIEECSVSDGIPVTWRYNAALRHFTWNLPPGFRPRIAVPRPHRSRVERGRDLVDETTGIPGQVNKATHTIVYFAVDEPFRCCGRRDIEHAVIQFVRHRWRLAGWPRERRDAWNLDGPESQSERHGQGEPYDPTYTTDPAHGEDSAGSDNQLVKVGPWDASGAQSAVIVHDFPGLLEPDHQRFLNRGGYIEWEFVTLLVCQELHGSAPHYLQHGMVRAKTRFRVRREYPGNGRDPTVTGNTLGGRPEGGLEYYNPCRPLADVLDETGLLPAFNNPRPHRIPLQ